MALRRSLADNTPYILNSICGRGLFMAIIFMPSKYKKASFMVMSMQFKLNKKPRGSAVLSSAFVCALPLLLAGFLNVPSARAQAVGLGLAQAKNCIACHTVDRQRVGPAFRAVAQRFAGHDGAVDYLAHSIRSGGGGRWGAIPMPAQPQVSEAEARELAKWILSLADAGAGADTEK